MPHTLRFQHIGVQDASRPYLNVLQELRPTTVCAIEMIHDILSPVDVCGAGRIKRCEILFLLVVGFL